ncbi:MAG: hypothetical protein ACREOU_10580 [Candidatus Eiseniibacteriota bacterium]
MGSGPGQFDGAFGLALNADGHLLVADGYNGRIQRFDLDGHYLGELRLGPYRTPRDIALGRTGSCTSPRGGTSRSRSSIATG